MKTHSYILLFAILLQTQFSFAQISNNTTPGADPVKETAATIFAGAAYVPNLHYYGRTDSLKSSALIPTVLIQFDSSGFYLSGSSVLIKNNAQSLNYAASIVEAGLKFGKLSGIAGSIYADKFFYKSQQLVQSSLKGQAGINLSYLNSIANINSSGIATFSDKTDFFTSLGLDHAIKFQAGQSVFVFTPTAVVNAGTQNFTHSYYKNNNFLLLPGTDQQVTQNSKQFNILSYEFSMPIVWGLKNFFLIATPGYVLPQNIITVANRPDISERASNLFYTNLTFLYSFKIKK